MSFGGVPVAGQVGTGLNTVNVYKVTGGTLAVTGGAFAAGAADCARLVTAAPGAGEFGIPANWGAGRGNWTAALANRVNVLIDDLSALAGPPSDIRLVTVAAAAGNLTIDIQNKVAVAAPAPVVTLWYDHSGIL